MKTVRRGILGLLLIAPLAAEPLPDAWTSLKPAWAAAHLKLAHELLKGGAIGFSDTQAGLARQLEGAQTDGAKEYLERRGKVKPPDKGWEEADWKGYETKRLTLYRKEAKEAAELLDKEAETWALRLDPDQAKVRKRRGEEKIPGLGWLPSETAANLRKGLVRFGDAWVKPDPAKSVSWEKAYGIPTEHFLVMSTLPRERALEIASDLEALYRIWEEILEGIGPARGEGENPKVWALQTAADLQACVAAIYPAGVETVRDPGTPGLAATNRNAFFDEQGPQRFGHSIRIGLFHEGSHLIHFDVPGSDVRSAPVWAVEGTAVLMETLETVKSPDWNAAAPPFRATARAFAAVVPEAVPALPGMDKPVFYQDNQTHYAQAFLLAHWLLYGHGGLHRADFLRYALGIGGGGEIPPCKGEALAGEIQRYLKSLKR